MIILRRSPGRGYAIAVACAGLLLLIDSTVAGTPRNFLLSVVFILSVVLSSAIGGWKPGVLTTVLGMAVHFIAFVEPRYALKAPNLTEVLRVVAYCIAGGSISGLSEMLHRAWARVIDRQRQLEEAEKAAQRESKRSRQQAEFLQVTLASIGDAVISTDAQARIVFLNPIAESLTGWKQADAVGRPLEEVFRIVNERTREPADNPALRALRTGMIVGLANHTLLIARDGTEHAIDDSAAPIGERGSSPLGVVLVFRDVSERRRDEEIRQRLAAIVASSEDAIISQSLEGEIRTWNAGATHLFGYSEAEAIGQPVSMIVPPERRDEDRAILERLIRGERVDHYETVRLAKDGRRLNISLTVSLLRDSAGHAIGASKVARDITERTRAEQLLRDSEARYRAIVESTPECVKIVARDGSLLQMNNAGLAMVEGDDSVLGRCVYDLVAPEDRAAFRAFNEQVCRGVGGSLSFDIIGLRGTRRRMESAAVPLPLGADDFAQLAVTRDVTQRVAEERLLAESRARLDYTVRLSGVGFWYCDLPFDVLNWDERVKQHFWLPPDAGVTIDTFYERIHSDDRDPTRRAIETAIQNHTPYDVVYRTVDPDSGDVKHVRALGGATYGPDGAAIRFDGVTVDITDVKRAELSLREADSRKDEFIALLAHELRNPLAPLRNGLEVLRLAGGSPSLIAESQKMMDRQLTHMVRLVDDLLDVSRINRNKMELRRTQLLLSDVISSAVETTQPLIQEAELELDISLPDEPVYLHADLTRLAQVFSNLLSNSAKFTACGGRIEIVATRLASQVAISIRDTGIGIPSEALAGIFDMFSQVDRSLERSAGGLGIGLALVKGLVEMHGGSVSAVSPGSGQGSTFTVTLPTCSEPAAPVPGRADDAAAPAGEKRRILVVDDNQDSAFTMAMMLRLIGNDVCTAHDGIEALEVAERFRPQVVVMDIGMPRMNGYDATRQLRAAPWGRDMVIVALTGWGQTADQHRSREAGCDGHLVKPVKLDDLRELLARLSPATSG